MRTVPRRHVIKMTMTNTTTTTNTFLFFDNHETPNVIVASEKVSKVISDKFSEVHDNEFVPTFHDKLPTVRDVNGHNWFVFITSNKYELYRVNRHTSGFLFRTTHTSFARKMRCRILELLCFDHSNSNNEDPCEEIFWSFVGMKPAYASTVLSPEQHTMVYNTLLGYTATIQNSRSLDSKLKYLHKFVNKCLLMPVGQYSILTCAECFGVMNTIIQSFDKYRNNEQVGDLLRIINANCKIQVM